MEQITKLFQVKEKLEPQGFLSDAEFATPTGCRILSVSAAPRISVSECQNGELRLTGVVEYKIIYVGQDNQVDATTLSKDFYERLLIKGMTPNTEVYLKAHAEEIEYGAMSPLKIRATIEISGWALKNVKLTECAAGNVEAMTETVSVDTIKILRDSVTEIAKEAEFPGGIDKVLSAESIINVNSVSTATEIAYVEGECITSVIYLINGSVQETKISADFNAEIISPAFTANVTVLAEGVAISASAIVVDAKSVLVEVTALLKGIVTSTEQAVILKDAYSLTHEIETECETEKYKKCVCRDLISDRVEASKRLNADAEKVRAILATSLPSVQGLTVTANEQGLGSCRYYFVAEGVLVARAIYLAESGGLHTIIIEAPFQMTSRDASCCPGATVFAAEKVKVTGFSLKQRLPDELELNATVSIDVAGFQETEITMLCSVTEKNVLPEDNTAITLYIADIGESMWHVCKTLRATEADLLAQNPELKLPLAGSEKIIFYREL